MSLFHSESDPSQHEAMIARRPYRFRPVPEESPRGRGRAVLREVGHDVHALSCRVAFGDCAMARWIMGCRLLG